ncbi:hypothetical protein [Streptomyces sp. NPDC085665]|uniref:hypothetical protein n=1 Tax=Streptomyces sp. NPDC085665 TaxID=3365735 RepID=UPI0037D0F259
MEGLGAAVHQPLAVPRPVIGTSPYQNWRSPLVGRALLLVPVAGGRPGESWSLM